MSKELWESQLEMNEGLQKQIDLLQEQIQVLAGMVKDLLPVVAKPRTEPGCKGKHCACGKVAH